MEITPPVEQVLATRFLIDGEAVVCGADDMSDFEKLHSGTHDASVFVVRSARAP
jgi:hypothetical protein